MIGTTTTTADTATAVRAAPAVGEWRLEFVTPSKAVALIESRYKNRGVRAGWVRTLANEMREGGFKTTHQGIAITSEGRVYDGQHRVHAIASLAGEIDGVWLWVYRSNEAAPDDLVFAVDGGAKRSDADAFNIKHGAAMPKSVVAAALFAGADRGVAARQPSRRMVVEFLETWADEVEWFMRVTALARKQYDGRTAPPAQVSQILLRAVVAHPLRRDAIERFVEVLYGAMPNEPRDRAPVLLREYLLRRGGDAATGGRTRDYEAGLAAAALRAFLDNREIRVLRTRDMVGAGFPPVPRERTTLVEG